MPAKGCDASLRSPTARRVCRGPAGGERLSSSRGSMASTHLAPAALLEHGTVVPNGGASKGLLHERWKKKKIPTLQFMLSIKHNLIGISKSFTLSELSFSKCLYIYACFFVHSLMQLSTVLIKQPAQSLAQQGPKHRGLRHKQKFNLSESNSAVLRLIRRI